MAAPKTRFNLVAITMVRNKARYLSEWIEFHLLQGFDRFVIYNHKSTDDIHKVLDPYLCDGIVELIDWPADFESINAGMFGEHDWADEQMAALYNKTFVEECLEVRDTWHIHGGCQRSALMDAMARYRSRADWIGIFDVDEFWFVPKARNHTIQHATDIPTVWQAVSALAPDYDHIRVSCHIYGTNGFKEVPGIEHTGLPRLNIEAYRFHYNNSDERYDEYYTGANTYCEKSLAKASMPTGTLIHHFTFEGVSPTPRTYNLNPSMFQLNHYQFLSEMEQAKKARANTNWGIDYWRPQDQFLCEIPDYRVGYLVPFVYQNMKMRYNVTAQAATLHKHSVASLAGKNTAQICVAFTHIDGAAHQLRKSVSSAVEYFARVEPDIAYKMVLVTLVRAAPMDHVATSELEYLRDIIPLIDAISVMAARTPWTAVIDKAVSLCQSSPYILFMEDLWEMRYKTDSFEDSLRPTLGTQVLTASIKLLERNPNMLQVLVGDTSSIVPEVRNTHGNWTTSADLPLVNYTMSNINWIERHVITNKTEALFLRETRLLEYMRQQNIFDHHGRPVIFERPDVTKNIFLANIDDQDEMLGCRLETCPLSPQWYRLLTPSTTYPRSAFRLGGTLTHTQRLRQLGTWAYHSKLIGSIDYANVEMSIGASAMEKQMQSAQLCLGDPRLDSDCRFDPDYLFDQATTGIMWRQRLILHKERHKVRLFDRP
eukprot:jgi/Hompol1/6355/HPOL_002105-RA